jgi:hypothetical protein
MTQDEGAAHDTTERLVLGATMIGLDQLPAGPVVVVVVVWMEVAVVELVAALDELGLVF